MRTRKVVFFTIEIMLVILLAAILMFSIYLRQDDDVTTSIKPIQIDLQDLQSSIVVDKSLKIDKPVYIIAYVGDIDGEVSDEWFGFYDFLVEVYERDGIKGAFSFYPSSMSEEQAFRDALVRMYRSTKIDLMQKSQSTENLVQEQKQFSDYMKESGIENVRYPKSFTLLLGKLRETDLKKLKDAGINVYFDVYYDEHIGPIASKEDILVLQYGVSFTRTGEAGYTTEFESPKEVFQAINNYNREDVKILKKEGVPIIPLYVHKQDFESKDCCDKIDEEKLRIYIETLLALKENPNVRFIKPSEVYNLKPFDK